MGSSHAMPFTQSGLVIEAVRQVVEAAKAADHTLPACGKALTDLGGACKQSVAMPSQPLARASSGATVR